ncbi:hypothetical protein F4780DRAFT_786730 [Xylariomycetidae sp. FL0641]|nr:hypothetical protein F4780DRAFT_786730 [Xylariomycetidae sp. FL0641]
MVRFVETDTAGLPLKRKQVAHACSKCRRRKRRCRHHNASDQSHGVAAPSTPMPDVRGTPTTEAHASRFVGDLNPEAIFMEATNLCSRRDVSGPGGIGIWHPQPSTTQSLAGNPSFPHSAPRNAAQEVLRSYVRDHCLPCCPPAPDYAVLQRIYTEKLDPLFPILSDQLANTTLDEVSEVLLRQVVSLAAATDPGATRHLRLERGGQLLSRNDFCASMSSSIQTILDAGMVTNRMLLVRLYAALSLYMQPTCPEDADLPALLNSRAVHQMHTLGLHMAGDIEIAKSAVSMRTFCCLWALDRISSAFYGRACLIHERDVGWDIDECIRRQEPQFRLLLGIINILDKVISLYRPGSWGETAPLAELPVFEQMILDAGASRVPNSCLASLEIFYHSVAILSSQSPAEGNLSGLPAPATNSRRSLAAERITSIVGEEFADQLCYLPIIPYGVSLSLSVSYRKMRHSKIPLFRNRGEAAFRANTRLLKSLDDTFWTAKTMVAMAEKVLMELDRAVASLALDAGTSDQRPTSPDDQNTEGHGIAQRDRDLDWSLFGNLPDLDVFGHFDPSFNLGAVDAALDGNLDFGASSNWYDWQQLWGPN